MFKVRNCATRDIDEVVEIERLSFNYPYNRTLFEDFLREEPEGFFVAEEDCAVRGYILTVAGEERAAIISLAVHPCYRRRGLGSALFNAAVSSLKDAVQILELQVAVSNTAAISFYESIGFLATDIIPRYYENREDARFMIKKLAHDDSQSF